MYGFLNCYAVRSMITDSSFNTNFLWQHISNDRIIIQYILMKWLLYSLCHVWLLCYFKFLVYAGSLIFINNDFFSMSFILYVHFLLFEHYKNFACIHCNYWSAFSSECTKISPISNFLIIIFNINIIILQFIFLCLWLSFGITLLFFNF